MSYEWRPALAARGRGLGAVALQGPSLTGPAPVGTAEWPRETLLGGQEPRV